MSLKLTVIVTCYNLERYIGEAIESVLRQSSSAPVELIVVDDASVDRSREVIKYFAPGALLALPRNRGVMHAMCAGLRRATGDVIAFLDGDDRWLPGKVEQVQSAFTEDPELTILSHDVAFIDGLGQRIKNSDSAQRENRRVRHADRPKFLKESLFEMRGHVWLGSAWSFRRNDEALSSFMQRVSELPENLQLYQDFPLAFWLASLPKAKLGWLDQVLMEYRLHDSNSSGAAKSASKFLSNSRKGLATRQFMLEILESRAAEPRFVRRMELLVREYQYYIGLAENGGCFVNLKKWCELALQLWSPSLSAKEAARLMLFCLMGPDRSIQFLEVIRMLRPNLIGS